MAKVLFSSADDFVAELKEDADHVDRDIVRLTYSRRLDGKTGYMIYTVLATAKVGDDVYALEALCGNVQPSAGVPPLVTETLELVEDGAKALGLKVRAGVIQ